MRRIVYWLNFRRRRELRNCGSCCLNCKFLEVCEKDGQEVLG